jgi:hypothetical protein
MHRLHITLHNMTTQQALQAASKHVANLEKAYVSVVPNEMPAYPVVSDVKLTKV